jgi:hypothetical protein
MDNFWFWFTRPLAELLGNIALFFTVSLFIVGSLIIVALCIMFYEAFIKKESNNNAQ